MKINHQKISDLELFLKNYVEKEVFCGCNVGVITSSDTAFLSVGYKALYPKKCQNSLNTMYDLASLTKVVCTTTLILKLIEEGSLSLNSKVSNYVENLFEKDLTIRHLITHTSGFSSDIEYKTQTCEELITSIITHKADFLPGERVVYSDLNFILLGLIIQKIKGNLATYAKLILFDPLKMTNTMFNPPKEYQDSCASYEFVEKRGGYIVGEVHDGKAHLLGGISGHAGLFSTIEDLSHFISMLLNDGIYEETSILSKYSIELLKKCQTLNLNEQRSVGWILSDQNYGLGDYYSNTTLFHSGFSGGSLLVDLERKVGFIILSNRIHPSRDNRKIYELRNNIHNLAYQTIEEV